MEGCKGPRGCFRWADFVYLLGDINSISSGVEVMNDHLGFSWLSFAGPLNWKYEGEVLDQRRRRMEEDK